MKPKNNCKFNHHFFNTIDTEPKAYWLGFLMADGGICDTKKYGCLILSIHLASKDAEHLRLFHETIQSKNKVSLCKNSVRSSHSSDILCSDLIKWGCVPRKTLILKFPKIGHSLLSHFVRGYFDGDGSATISGTRLFLQFLGTKEFLTRLKEVVGVNNKLIQRGKIWSFQISKISECERISGWMYKNASVYLARKKLTIDQWREMPHPGSGNYERKAMLNAI